MRDIHEMLIKVEKEIKTLYDVGALKYLMKHDVYLQLEIIKADTKLNISKINHLKIKINWVWTDYLADLELTPN